MAGRIRDRLASHYGPDAVFMDIDSIPFGTDFREHIHRALGDIDILLAIIGPKWTGLKDAGSSRIKEGNDYVRIEVEVALVRKIKVIPVLVDGAQMPKEDELPEALAPLSFLNAASVDTGIDFHVHMDRLIKSMDRVLKTVPEAAARPKLQPKAKARTLPEKPVERQKKPPRSTPNTPKSKKTPRPVVTTVKASAAVDASAVQAVQTGTGPMPSRIKNKFSDLRGYASAGGMMQMLELAYLYRDGYEGWGQNEAEAVAWFKRVAEGGESASWLDSRLSDSASRHAEAMNALGEMYERGRGVAADRDGAIRWYRLAAKRWLQDAAKKARENLRRLGVAE